MGQDLLPPLLRGIGGDFKALGGIGEPKSPLPPFEKKGG